MSIKYHYLMAPFIRNGIPDRIQPDLPESWQRIRSAFLVEKERASGSRRTPTEYARILDRFFDGVPAPAAVSPLDVEVFAYGPGLSGALPSGSTICVRLAALSGFYELARVNGLVAANPAAIVRRPKAIAPLPRGPEPEAIRRILDAIPETGAGLRDRAVILLIVLSGLRRSEALGLRASDVDLRRREFLTHVKGGRERLRVIPEPVVGALAEALAAEGRAFETLGPDELLFRVSGAGFYANLRSYATTAGVTGVCPHALRHSAAKLRRLAGASLEEVSALLGHRSFATTVIYLQRLETEPDAGWREAAGVLGLSERTGERDAAETAGPSVEDRSASHSMVWAHERARPASWRTTGRVYEHPPGPSDRRQLFGPPLSGAKPTARSKRAGAATDA